MPACLNCKSKGWFLIVNNIGLCGECEATHQHIIQNNCSMLIKSLKLIQSSVKADTKLGRIKIARESCVALEPYSAKGIPTVEPYPKELLLHLEHEEQTIVEEEILNACFTAREKSKDASSDSAKLSPYASSIQRLMKIMDYIDDVYKLEKAIGELRTERDSVRAHNFIKKANIWVAKGNDKKAVEILLEALIELRHDSTPDSHQSELIIEIQSMIHKLKQRTRD